MSRRKQQNPKPLKYDDLGESSKQNSNPMLSTEVSQESPMLAPVAEPLRVNVDETAVKNEMESPIIAVSSPSNPVSPNSQTSPSASLETLLGVPDEAPLKVERSSDTDTFKILSSTKIPKGAGLDPLSAQKIDAGTIEGVDNPQIVSFSQKETKVFFKLESKINCGWLKYLGEPSEQQEANLNIYFVGGKLWVEVIKPLEEGEQLVAEFVDPSSDREMEKPVVESDKPIVKGEGNSFPCDLCGILFRNPNNLAAHRNHYCSKLSKNGTVAPVETTTSSTAAGPSSSAMPQLRLAYMCKLCQFMSLEQTDIESHVREVHKLKRENGTSFEISNTASEKTYCSDCEISFKRPESYQIHKLRYCKRRSQSVSPQSNISTSPQPNNFSHNVKDLYQTVSIMDSQSAMAAAAAAMASGFSVGLPSVLGLPALTNPLPALPLKLLQSPAIIAHAMENAAKAMGIGLSPPSESPRKNEETALDLTNKNDIATAAAMVTTASKRSSESDSELSPPAKRVAALSTPSGTSRSAGVRAADGFQKKDKINRPIFRCESCSIPFYKKDVYEAHKQHYCSGRVSNSMESTNTKQTEEEVEDERLVITFTCNQCGNNYRTRDMFRAHQCDIGVNQQFYSCEECDFRSLSQSSLHEHMESHVKVNLTYKCDLCGYRGNTMRGMRQHGRTHLAKNEEYDDSSVSVIEHAPPGHRIASSILNPLHAISDVDEQLLRMKNEPYKKRRSRKHYQKSENLSFVQETVVHTQHSPAQPNENDPFQKSLPSPASTKSSQSPLHNSSSHINSETIDSPQRIKREPMELPELPRHVPIPSLKKKPHICSCNASFSSMEVFEAHKQLYCPNKRTHPTTVTASS